MVALTPGVSHTDSVTFQGHDGMWGGGTQAYDAQFFMGISWNLGGQIFNGIGCDPIFGDCYGFAVGANTHGSIGQQYHIHQDNGYINASEPASISLNVGAPDLNGNIQVSSSAALANFTQQGTLQTHFPSIQITDNLIVDAHASLFGTGCAVVCGSVNTGDLLGLNLNVPVFSWNQNDNGALEVLGFNVPGFSPNAPFSIKYPPNSPIAPVVGHADLTPPVLDLNGVGGCNSVSCTISAHGQSPILTMTLDALNTALLFAGIPPLSWGVSIPYTPASINFSAVQVNIGPQLSLEQTFELTVPTTVPVSLFVQETGVTYHFNAGDTITINDGGYSQLHLLPTYDLTGSSIHNITDMNVGLVGNISGLCASGLGIGGCAVNYNWDGPDTEIGDPLFNRTWAYDFGTVNGATLLVPGSGTNQPVTGAPVPEPVSSLLFGTGLIGLGGMMRKRAKRSR